MVKLTPREWDKTLEHLSWFALRMELILIQTLVLAALDEDFRSVSIWLAQSGKSHRRPSAYRSAAPQDRGEPEILPCLPIYRGHR
jgi:hypothetical protein